LTVFNGIRRRMNTDTADNNTISFAEIDWAWPPALDALQAAPNHHRLIFENDHVRVLEVRIPAGAVVPLHTHRWPALLHLQTWSDHVRRDETGAIVFDSRNAERVRAMPTVIWSEPLPPHSVENVGDGELLVMSVELKNTDHR